MCIYVRWMPCCWVIVWIEYWKFKIAQPFFYVFFLSSYFLAFTHISSSVAQASARSYVNKKNKKSESDYMVNSLGCQRKEKKIRLKLADVNWFCNMRWFNIWNVLQPGTKESHLNWQLRNSDRWNFHSIGECVVAFLCNKIYKKSTLFLKFTRLNDEWKNFLDRNK